MKWTIFLKEIKIYKNVKSSIIEQYTRFLQCNNKNR